MSIIFWRQAGSKSGSTDHYTGYWLPQGRCSMIMVTMTIKKATMGWISKLSNKICRKLLHCSRDQLMRREMRSQRTSLARLVCFSLFFLFSFTFHLFIHSQLLVDNQNWITTDELGKVHHNYYLFVHNYWPIIIGLNYVYWLIIIGWQLYIGSWLSVNNYWFFIIVNTYWLVRILLIG